MASNSIGENVAQDLLQIAQELHRYLTENSLLDLSLAFESAVRNSKPASKEFLVNLRTRPLNEVKGEPCPVCLAEYMDDDLSKELPCKHHFHAECILPWLEKTNSCPVCRREYPTENSQEEERRREREDREARQQRRDELHDSMFG